MKVALLDLLHHTYKIPTFCRLLPGKVSIITTQKGAAKFSLNEEEKRVDEVIKKEEKQSWREFFRQIERYTERLDLIISLTARGAPNVSINFADFKPQCIWISMMHHANLYRDPEMGYGCNTIRRLLSRLENILPPSIFNMAVRKTIGEVDPLVSPLPYRNVDGIIVLHGGMKQFLISNGWEKPIHVFYSAIFEEVDKSSGDELSVVIPGRITEKNRKYNRVMDVANRRWGNKDVGITINLAGRSDKMGRGLRNKLSDMKDKPWIDWSSSERIPETKFRDILVKSDLLFSPLQKTETKSFGTEAYGHTKSSGVVWDGITFGKPVLAPDFFVKNLDLEMFSPYKSIKEAIIFMENLRDKKKLKKKLKKDARQAAQKFDLKKQSRALKLIIESHK